MKRVLSAVALMIAVLGVAQPALADPRRHDGWNAQADLRRHDGWNDGWRDDWRWDRPHRYARPPREVIMVYPPPPVVYAQPRVVFMDPGPVQAVPTSPPYTDGFGRYCREYQSTMTVGGNSQRGYGTACLQPDGSWRIVN